MERVEKPDYKMQFYTFHEKMAPVLFIKLGNLPSLLYGGPG